MCGGCGFETDDRAEIHERRIDSFTAHLGGHDLGVGMARATVLSIIRRAPGTSPLSFRASSIPSHSPARVQRRNWR